MHVKLRAILLLTVVVLTLLIIYKPVEPFSTQQSKASTIYNWFTTQKSPSYTEYKRNISGSNIVEYEDVLKLFQDGNLTLSSVAKVL